MAFTIAKEAAPLAQDAHGVVRIGGTRVTLDSVVGAFLQPMLRRLPPCGGPPWALHYCGMRRSKAVRSE